MTDYDGARTESATDMLRRMLDERGVEWTAPNSILRDDMTSWVANGFDYDAFEVPDGSLVLSAAHQDDLTPEQAIAATLGAGTCHDEGDPSDFCCSACGVRMFTNTSDTYTMIASDGRTIIEHPNYCPNCGAKVVDPTTNDVDAEEDA